jgi:alpha-glucosidase
LGYGHTFACNPFFIEMIMNTILFILCWALIAFNSQAQVTLRLTKLPANTSSNDSLFFAGSINQWNPGDKIFVFKKGGGNIATLVIPEGTGTIQYKITRGNWAKAEADAKGNDIGNRSFTFTGKPQTIDLTVESWKVQTEAVSTAASNVKILADSFSMPQLNRKRRIWIYLPPDYESSQKKYPVIYMHDGQNLFDNKTSYSGEWGVDETLNQLFEQGDYGAIVIGIDNGGNKRLDEYSPWKNPMYGGGEGDEYIDFIKYSLKPCIDHSFRTKTGPETTCLWGSSMGGLISTYGVLKYPETFGKAGIFSPAYWFSFDSLNQTISAHPKISGDLRMVHIAGEKEGANMKTFIYKVTDAFLQQKTPASNLKTKIDADGTHNETYWKREFAEAYKWLFSNE